jgi:hypothetical protein
MSRDWANRVPREDHFSQEEFAAEVERLIASDFFSKLSDRQLFLYREAALGALARRGYSSLAVREAEFFTQEG